MRPIRLLPFVVVAVLALAACSSSAQPGWTYAPAPPATPAASAGGSGAPSGGAPSASAPASAVASALPSAPGGTTTLELTAQNITFDKKDLEAPAGQPFAIHFVNKDAGIPHDVAIRLQDGTEKWKGDQLNDTGEVTYQVPALEAGTYTFICTIHPIPQMTGTLTVK